VAASVFAARFALTSLGASLAVLAKGTAIRAQKAAKRSQKTTAAIGWGAIQHRRQAGGECEHIAAASGGQESDGTAQRKQAELIASFSKEPEPLPAINFL